MENKLNINKIIPIMLAFFTMGFVDLVGIATNHVKEDFTLSSSQHFFGHGISLVSDILGTYKYADEQDRKKENCPSKHDSDTCRTCYPQLNLR